jgi:hypothetical protein
MFSADAGTVEAATGTGGVEVVVVGGCESSAFVSFPLEPVWGFDEFVFFASSVKLSFWRLLGKHMRAYESGMSERGSNKYVRKSDIINLGRQGDLTYTSPRSTQRSVATCGISWTYIEGD